jgi:hypothetical protein
MFEKWYSVIFITLLPPFTRRKTIKIQFPPLYKGRVRVG